MVADDYDDVSGHSQDMYSRFVTDNGGDREFDIGLSKRIIKSVTLPQSTSRSNRDGFLSGRLRSRRATG